MLYNKYFCIRKKTFLGLLIGLMIAQPLTAASQIAIPAALVAFSALSTSFYMSWQALEDYKESSKKPQTKNREKTEFWLLKSWNKIQRGILGRATTSEILKQNLIEFIYQSNAWWRQYKDAAIKAFIATAMGLMGWVYLSKALKRPYDE